MVKVFHIINIIEKIAPLYLAIDKDREKIGLVVGSKDFEIDKILISLELTDKVIEEAISLKCNMIITHHPFIYNPITNLNNDYYKNNILVKLIKNNIVLYTAHTNLDASSIGINFALAEKFGIKNPKSIVPSRIDDLRKLVIYIPKDYEDKVRDKLLSQDLFETEKYGKMSFMTSGEGTFLPFNNANPFIGVSGKIEKTNEYKLEVLVEKNNAQKILNEIRSIHPYEEIAYDLFPVEIFYPEAGIGRWGELEREVTLKKFAETVKEKLKAPYLRIAGNLNKKVKKIGILSGSGASYISTVLNLKLDTLITGDIKHSEALEIIANGVTLIDVSHFYSERIFADIIYDLLNTDKNVSLKAKILKSKINTEPFCLL